MKDLVFFSLASFIESFREHWVNDKNLHLLSSFFATIKTASFLELLSEAQKHNFLKSIRSWRHFYELMFGLIETQMVTYRDIYRYVCVYVAVYKRFYSVS